MNLFETVKSAVTVKQAAEHYGCKVNRGDMICCPFHDDLHPSMKLNRDYFYCFGCGATGDVIDFVARLFGLSSYEAAKKLAYDFGKSPIRWRGLSVTMRCIACGCCAIICICWKDGKPSMRRSRRRTNWTTVL